MSVTTRGGVVAAAVCVLAWGGPVRAGAPTWVEVESPNFTVYSNAGAKEARQVAQQFEQVRLAFEKVWKGARTRSPVPIVIVATRDEDGLERLIPEYFAQKGRAHPAGITVPGYDKYYVAMRTDVTGGPGSSYNPYHLLYHEYIHVLVGLNYAAVPPWLGEGLAEFFGATIVEGDRLVVGKPLPWHIQDLRDKPMLSLARLIEVEHDSPEYNEETKAGIFYAQSWALLHMLATDPSGVGARRLDMVLGRLKRGDEPQAAVREVLGDLTALDKELQAYVRRYTFRYGHVDADARVRLADVPVRELSSAATLAVQADFEAHRGAFDAARTLAEQAVQQDPAVALAHEALGYVAWREKGLDAALPHYRRAVELDPGRFAARFMVGQALLQQKTPEALEQAEAALKASIELNNEFAPAYEHLASVIVERGGDLERALGLVRRAVALQPSASDPRLTLSWILQRAGRNDEARAQAQSALSVARGDSARARVQKWLTELERAPVQAVVAGHTGSTVRVVSGTGPTAAEQQQRCDAGQLDECAALADRYSVGDGVQDDKSRALALYTKACDGGLAAGCLTLGWAQMGGALGPRDPAAAARAFGQACDGGNLDGCLQAGFVLAFAADVTHDEAAAAPYLRKACDGGTAQACAGLGVLYMSGKGLARDLARAAPLLERGCAANDAMGCVNLATLLEAGVGVERNVARARELYAKACAKGVPAACAKGSAASR